MSLDGDRRAHANIDRYQDLTQYFNCNVYATHIDIDTLIDVQHKSDHAFDVALWLSINNNE